MTTATLEDRARFFLEAARGRVREAAERLERRARDLARRSAEWTVKVEAGSESSYLSDLTFLESDVAEIRAAQADLERERAIVAALEEVVGA